ncbi:MAG: OmpA family protein [Sneathiella sp.]|uniref:OmpA family protein n=1 Tax=Sneathiella sp. TaxID=1964365 RepID=UPI003002C748
MVLTNKAVNARLLLGACALTVSLASVSHTTAFAAQPIVISGTDNSGVSVNLPTPRSDTKYTAPQRIIDGSDVIILIPPSLQKKVPAAKIVTPRMKPEISLPETAAVDAAPTPVEITTTPVPPINPAKLPPKETAELASSPEAPEKFETVPEKTALAATTPLPTAAEAATVKQDVASDAETKMATVDAISKPEEIAPLPPQAEVVEKQSEPNETAPTSQQADVKEEQPEEKEIVVAALTPEKKPGALPMKRATGDMTRILFPAGEAALPGSAETEIQAIADQLQTEGQNVQLIAYATGDSNSAARRLSLGRALSVRSKLIDLGVKNNKIEVRALGQPTGDGPVDRVDLVMIAR